MKAYLTHLFFPEICAVCKNPLQEGEEALCMECILNLPYTEFHSYPDNALLQQFRGRVDIVFASSCFYFHKEERIQSLLHNIKYNKHRAAAFFIGKLHGELLNKHSLLPKQDFIIPVPLHPSKQKKRGYNQSEEYALGLSKILKIKTLTNILKRILLGTSQTSKDREERLSSLIHSFEVVNSSLIQGKNILLVDDVITSGATIEVCARLLKAYNCTISVASIAYTSLV